MEEKIYTIQELCELTGFSRRTIRYYVQEGLIDPPAGRGRGGFYFDSHLRRRQEIRGLQDQGLRISEIQHLPAKGEQPEPAPLREVWIRYPVEPGLEIHLSRDLEERKRKKVQEIIRLAKTVLKGVEGDE